MMAKLGFRKMDEMIGRVDMLEMRPAVDHWKARGLDFSQLLYNPPVPSRVRPALHDRAGSRPGRGARLQADRSCARGASKTQTPVEFKLPIRNVHRTVGAMLSGEIARQYGSAGLPDDTIQLPVHRLGRARASGRFSRAASRSNSKATPTITSARDFPAAS